MEIYVLQYELRVASFIYSSLRLFIYSKRRKRGKGGEGGNEERGEGQGVKVHACINIVVIIR